MTKDPSSVEGQLEALRHYFMFRYRDEIRRRYLVFRSLFPLADSSRLDVVRLNGGSRVHFLYQAGAGSEHLVVIHDLTMQGGNNRDEDERRFVQRALKVEFPVVHFVVEPPYVERFDLVDREAVSAVTRHAQLRPGSHNPMLN